jgi:hypothetical protein
MPRLLVLPALLAAVLAPAPAAEPEPPARPGAILAAPDVLFGIGQSYDQGRQSHVAINSHGLVLETHASPNFDTLYCHTGTLAAGAVAWGPSARYGAGSGPCVALNSSGAALEVHAETDGAGLACQMGSASEQGVRWRQASRYATGRTPAAALNDQGTVVEVHQDPARDELVAMAGRVKGGVVAWGAAQPLGPGRQPAVALTGKGGIVLVHQGAAGAGLLCRLGKVQGDTIQWGPARACGEGAHPAVAWTRDGLIVEVHHDPSGLKRRLGTVQGETVTWTPEAYFDDGEDASVACAGELAIQTHGSEHFTSLWYSVSRVLDRADWMRDRLGGPLRDKTLKQIALPASHDAGMYGLGAQAILGKTQDLNLHDQLAAGVRYFDLRPRWADNDLYLCHGPITGPKLDEVLADVRRFLAEGHRELAILKFSHYSGFDDAQGESRAYRELARRVKAALEPWLVKAIPRGQRLCDIPLKEFLAGGGKVLVVCDGAFPLKAPQEGLWVYRDWDAPDAEAGDLRVFDQYANKVVLDKMKDDQTRKFQAYDGRCQRPGKDGRPVPCDLFLLSWTLTPPSGVWLVSKEANRTLPSAAEFLKPNGHGLGVNLFYTDYVEYSHNVDMSILRLDPPRK